MTATARPRILDLFCGAGGAAVGYHRAGFDVVGVDIKPQPRYPFEFHQADAMTYRLEGFAVIHASPPCQAYSISRNNGSHPNAPELVPETLARLRASGLPWIVENVVGAPLPSAIQLCGASFGLKTGKFDLNRHRYFQTSFGLLAPPCQHRRGQTIGVYGNGTNSYHRAKFGRCVSVDEMREAMGIDWMTRKELSQAIPPAYTEWIGQRLLEILRYPA
jgi:DNA (cytosine-5)-methyltransferase 1